MSHIQHYCKVKNLLRKIIVNCVKSILFSPCWKLYAFQCMNEWHENQLITD